MLQLIWVNFILNFKLKIFKVHLIFWLSSISLLFWVAGWGENNADSVQLQLQLPTGTELGKILDMSWAAPRYKTDLVFIHS